MTPQIMDFVNEWRLGHVATVGPDGPNVSPKGTFQALDAGRIAFAEIRSPQTRDNIAADPRVEVNMVDVFARKGVRFRGEARFHASDSDMARVLSPRWTQIFGEELAALFRGFVVIDIVSTKPLKTPAYDLGATEAQLRMEYLSRFVDMQRALVSS